MGEAKPGVKAKPIYLQTKKYGTSMFQDREIICVFINLIIKSIALLTKIKII